MSEQKKLWGGAFKRPLNDLAWEFGQSLQTDQHFLVEELDVSIAHAKMLGSCGLISKSETSKLVKELTQCKREALSKRFLLSNEFEDMHSAIETRLKERLGELGAKLHMGRSRNDQIATVARLWVIRRSRELHEHIKHLQGVLFALASKYQSAPMPGFTHQQRAQPITLGYHLLAYFWTLQRDGVRLQGVIEESQISPLGSAAIAGTSFQIDRDGTAKALGFEAATASALDGVSDRDFIGDALHCCATLGQHLSRLCQEIVLWSGSEFRWLTLDDSVSTGSSIMPQKRNPDFAELIRGAQGNLIGNWVAFQAMMKALPMAYNRDQQWDKPGLVQSFKLAKDSTLLVAKMLSSAQFDLEKMKHDAGDDFSTATSVADSLAAKGMPFREAHELVGKLVAFCREHDLGLGDVSEPQLKALSPKLDRACLRAAEVQSSIDSKVSAGGPGKAAFTRQLKTAGKLLRAPGYPKMQ